jgi:hypothetical protein
VKLITGMLVAGLLTGCASAEQRMESKRDYRDAQVEAIKVQAEQRTARETSEQLAEAAMWQSLAEAVKANPESASHFAIVMAVAASKSDASGESNTAMATIKTERDVTALDWAKVLAGPVLGTVTQVGIAALNTDLQKEISRNNTARDINDSDNDARLYGVIGDIVDGRDTGTSVTYTVSDNATVNTGTYTQDNDVTTTTTTTTTTTSNDDRVYVIGTTVEEADAAVDSVSAETTSFGIPDDDPVVDTADDTDEFSCDEPQFSPLPPECI